ncbi:MAG: hypothetical protein U1F67_11685 [Rubrivivax sp.]
MRSPFGSGYSYPPYGSGNAINTWYPQTIVDAKGKEVPWSTPGAGHWPPSPSARPVAGQKFFIMGGGSSSHPHRGCANTPARAPFPDLGARMRAGEFTPLFYADLAGMPRWNAARSGA